MVVVEDLLLELLEVVDIHHLAIAVDHPIVVGEVATPVALVVALVVEQLLVLEVVEALLEVTINHF